MQINDLVQNKNNINIFEDFTNFELEMAKIPDKYTVNADLLDARKSARAARTARRRDGSSAYGSARFLTLPRHDRDTSET